MGALFVQHGHEDVYKVVVPGRWELYWYSMDMKMDMKLWCLVGGSSIGTAWTGCV